MALALNDVVDTALACVCEKLTEAGRPACNCYPVVGAPVMSFCCECGAPGQSGELRAYVENLYPVDGSTLFASPRIETCRRGPWAVDLALSLSRCHPTIDEQGNLPDPADLEQAARDLHTDIEIIRKALTCCDGIRLVWRSLGVENDPEGGCSEITARVTIGLD